MKKIICALILVLLLGSATPSFATHGVNGKVCPRSIGAGVCSFLVWPGIGQVINNQKREKVLTHAVIGLVPFFRFWSAYDAFVDRNGGVWDHRI